jgi:excisionase family DNA binding protein
MKAHPSPSLPSDPSKTPPIAPVFTPVDRYLNKSEMAKVLGVSVRTLENLMATRQIPYYKIGGWLVRFRYSDSAAFLAKSIIAIDDPEARRD